MGRKVSQFIAVGILSSMLSACAAVNVPFMDRFSKNDTEYADRVPIPQPHESSTASTDKPTENSESAHIGTKDSTPKQRTVTVTVEASDNSGSDVNSGTSNQSGTSGRSTGEFFGYGDKVRKATKSEEVNKPTFPVSEYRRVTAISNRISTEVPPWMDYIDLGADERNPAGTEGKLFAAENQIMVLAVVDGRGMNNKQRLAGYQDYWESDLGMNITYKAVTSRGFVISGRQGGDITYMVAELHDGKLFLGIWEYPVSRKLEMDPVITRFYKAFTVR